jgi:lipopolysaccharide biosynthesis protein
MAKVIAIYLPQFHPIPENDTWWGKGFTEWTNVGKAKPLFKGHYQPRVPADLGYYDLRLSEVREAQADLARAHGVEGFCYWHYWFGNGKRLLERPFNEVLASGKPDFPFCLAWANHSWKNKQFNKEGDDTMLIEQLYGGEADYTEHFNALLPAFKDSRYIKVDNKPIFMIYAPFDMPDVAMFMTLWQQLAQKNGLNGIHFVGNTHEVKDIEVLQLKGFDAICLARLFHVFKQEFSLFRRAYVKTMRLVFKTGRILDYAFSAKYFSGKEDYLNHIYPSIFPNWDHSPRSGREGHILHNSNPKAFKKHVKEVLKTVKDKPHDNQIVFIRSWNEWAEGNYIEPDLKFGKQYLEALKEAIDEDKIEN